MDLIYGIQYQNWKNVTKLGRDSEIFDFFWNYCEQENIEGLFFLHSEHVRKISVEYHVKKMYPGFWALNVTKLGRE